MMCIHLFPCEIQGCYGGKYEHYYLLGCEAKILNYTCHTVAFPGGHI